MANAPLPKYSPAYLSTHTKADTSTQRSATRELFASYWYAGELLNAPSVMEQLSGGRLNGKSVDLEFSNADGTFSADRDAGTLTIGNMVNLSHYLPEDTTTTRTYLYGKITAIDIPGEVATITVTVEDPDSFSGVWPAKVYETDDWALASSGAPYDTNGTTKINPSTDLGRAYPVSFGRARKVRAVYVYADYDNDYYYYIVNRGVIEATNADKGTKINVYRNKRLVGTSEYTVYDGSQASPFPGYAYIRFTREQSDGSNLYEITVDLYGLEMGGSTAQRNPAYILQWLLSDATVGLGQSVNAASFTTAATTLSTLGGGSKAIYIDGGIDEQVTVQDLIDHLAAECSRSYIYKNSSDEWCITTDTYQSTSQATFGRGDNNYRNIISINSYKSIDRVKTVTVKYGKDKWTGEFKYSLTRDVLYDGEELVYECPLIYDHESADLICCYLQRRLLYGNYEVDLDLGMEARDLVMYQPITVVQKWLSPLDRSEITNINGQFQVRSIERGLYQWSVVARTNSSDIYTYVAGTLPSDETDDLPADYSFTPPSAPTGLAIATSGTRQGTDGNTTAYYRLQATAPTVNCQYLEFGYKEKNAANYIFALGQLSSGTWYVTIEGLVPGQLYYFAARAVNNANAAGYTQGTLAEITNGGSGYTAPGDTTAPAVPTGLTATAGTGKSIVLDWDDNTEKDLSCYYIYRHTSNSFGGASKIAEARVSRFTDTVPAYSTTYYYWLKAVDFTGNASSNTAVAVSATSSKITNDEINTVAADKITTGTITGQTITISASSYLDISAPSGIRVLSGGDIELQGTTSLTNYIRWKMTSGGSSYYLYEGAYYNTSVSHLVYRVYPGATKTQYYCIGNGYTNSFYGIEIDCSRFVLNTWGSTSSYYKQLNFTYSDNALYPAANSGGTRPALGLTTNPWSGLILGNTSKYWTIIDDGSGNMQLYLNGSQLYAFGNDGSIWQYDVAFSTWGRMYPVHGTPSTGKRITWHSSGYAYWA